MLKLPFLQFLFIHKIYFLILIIIKRASPLKIVCLSKEILRFKKKLKLIVTPQEGVPHNFSYELTPLKLTQTPVFCLPRNSYPWANYPWLNGSSTARWALLLGNIWESPVC